MEPRTTIITASVDTHGNLAFEVHGEFTSEELETLGAMVINANQPEETTQLEHFLKANNYRIQLSLTDDHTVTATIRPPAEYKLYEQDPFIRTPMGKGLTATLAKRDLSRKLSGALLLTRPHTQPNAEQVTAIPLFT